MAQSGTCLQDRIRAPLHPRATGRTAAFLIGCCAFFLVSVAVPADDAAGAEDAAAANEVRAFIDGYFTRFAELTALMRENDDSVGLKLVHHTRANFVRSTEASIRRTGTVPEVDIIAKLMLHGPKSWDVKDLRVAGDVARATILFSSIRERQSEPIPFSFRFIRAEGKWLVLRAKDLRPKKIVVEIDTALPADRTLSAASTPDETLKIYLDYLVANVAAVDLKNFAAARSALLKIGDNVAVLWGEDPPSKRGRNQATTKLLMQDIAGWDLVESGTEGAGWSATIAVTMGERNPLADYLKTKPRVIFSAVRQGDVWLLSDFKHAR
ncbi:MAG: hypothetical protein JKY60_06570 [Kordiimonadaceae bacterium]|nr:hypothetical protein [Kordiimonadaceae bacterium]